MMPQTDLHTQLGDQRNFWNRKGLMLILSSPSGAGKTSVSRAILAQDDNISLSISVTTRPARPAEIDSHHYHFITQSEFVKMRDHQELLEWAHVFGNYYGTPRAPVEQTLANGKDVLFDIEWQGTQQLVEKAPADVVKVFLLPPSRATLLQRLQDRAQDTPDVVAKRMNEASNEMNHWAEYDWVLVNDDLEATITRVQAILLSERLRRNRQVNIRDFLKTLQE